ncbi:hypothetical protein [Streptomyces sp. NBC_01445]|uniref:hypothetical protein n=1 Tax=Streptomyces sp. NBC_01445 TaxID=2903869 RepID=UPI002DDC23BA|nr:hypothetical protein [Streptomyces sp. NBC_01445]WSE05521.1 hypothetical protein OG574_20415 [Streptomyces sp. NBC_01445]
MPYVVPHPDRPGPDPLVGVRPGSHVDHVGAEGREQGQPGRSVHGGIGEAAHGEVAGRPVPAADPVDQFEEAELFGEGEAYVSRAVPLLAALEAPSAFADQPRYSINEFIRFHARLSPPALASRKSAVFLDRPHECHPAHGVAE